MTRRRAALLLLPAALLGWSLIGMLGALVWAHPAISFLLVSTCVVATAAWPGQLLGRPVRRQAGQSGVVRDGVSVPPRLLRR